jgi:hypothetical protein
VRLGRVPALGALLCLKGLRARSPSGLRSLKGLSCLQGRHARKAGAALLFSAAFVSFVST